MLCGAVLVVGRRREIVLLRLPRSVLIEELDAAGAPPAARSAPAIT